MGTLFFKYLTKFWANPKNIKTIIDKQNKFIIISLVHEKTGVVTHY